MELHGRNIIAGTVSQIPPHRCDEQLSKSQTYISHNPITGEKLPGEFFTCTSHEVSKAVSSAEAAYRELLDTPPLKIATFLQTVAEMLVTQKEVIINRCALETALPRTPRLESEFIRVATTLNMYAEMISNGGVAQSCITEALPDRTPVPRPHLQMSNIGIGPIVVIEASNFPLAFGVLGNDTASAWAAGCPVIAKAHPLHPGTSEIIAGIICDSLAKAGLPNGMFSMLHGGPEVVESLVKHPGIRGVGFTGSHKVGIAIREYASERPDPIELSLEMGSVNPLFIFEEALQNDTAKLAEQVVNAALGSSGQVCTSPGIIFIPSSNAGLNFQSYLTDFYLASGVHTLLGENIASSFRAKVLQCSKVPGVSSASTDIPRDASQCQVAPAIFTTSSAVFMNTLALREENFGPSLLIVECAEKDFPAMAKLFAGELTAMVHCPTELVGAMPHLKELCATLVPRVGRLVFNGFSPGVELCRSINHSGPWPASSSRFSAVGPDAVMRWVRRLCFQNAPAAILPRIIQA